MTIEITDEMHAKLIELATEMTTQDMRCTKMPHMFQIREQKEVAAHEGCGEIIWIDTEGDCLRSEEEIKNFIVEHLYENDERILEVDYSEGKEKALELYEEMDELDELNDYLEDREYRLVSVTTEPSHKNTFLTAKACQEHIDKNHYHYNEPIVYLNHAWRNPEMELVSTFLCSLVGKKMHS